MYSGPNPLGCPSQGAANGREGPSDYSVGCVSTGRRTLHNANEARSEAVASCSHHPKAWILKWALPWSIQKWTVQG
jgi:hypothetical protein